MFKISIIDDRKHSIDTKIDLIRKNLPVGKYSTTVKWSSNTGRLFEIDTHHLVNWIKDLNESVIILEEGIRFKENEVQNKLEMIEVTFSIKTS